MATDPVRCVIADDDVLLREGLAELLSRHGMEVVGLAGDAEALVELVARERPGLAIIDVRMPPDLSTEGLLAAREIAQDFPETALLVLSAHVEVEEAVDVLERGWGVGYLLKSRVVNMEDFLEHVDRVAQGGSVVDPGLVKELVAAGRRNERLGALSPRELEVLSYMAQGYSNAGIARRLYVSEGTVEKHVHSILPKLQLPEGEDSHRRVLAVLTFLDMQ